MEKPINTIQSQSQIPRTSFAYFWYVSKPFKWWMFGAIFLVVSATVLGQGSSLFFKFIIDAVEVGNHEAAMRYALLYPAALFSVHTLFRGSGFVGGKWVVKVKKYGYDVLSQQTMKHSHSFFTNRFAGALLSKINNVNNAMDQLIPDLLWAHLTAFTSLVVTISILLTISVQAALVFVLLVFVLVVVNSKLAPTRAEYSKAAAESATALRGRLVDVITNIQAVRQYVQTKHETDAIDTLSTNIEYTNGRNWVYSELVQFWNGAILFVFSLAMFWFLVAGWKEGSVSTGDLVLVLALYSQILSSLIFIGRAFSNTARAIGEMEEGLDELLTPFDIVDVPDADPLFVNKAQIDWNNVCFDFDGKAVFDKFNLQIPAGQRLGLVGQSGAGKSTFVSLLLRQHDLAAGSITIDEQDISRVTQDSLRRAIAVVPQEPALFHRSIRENILYGKSEATDEEVIEVAKKAQAHDFIMELPLGYETMVGERGVKLSGGQKQRVAIARAMLKDAPILVLDEATSALDSESEVAIQKALEKLMEGRTVIAVAHRLSTLRKMDRIIVMENGKVIEDGDHESLTHSGGVYERLWNHQAGGFLQDSEEE